jgi:hypothetical protein
MESFFISLGIVAVFWMVVGAIYGVVYGIVTIFRYFIRLQATLSRIENLIKAEDYTGAEEINHEQ